MKWLSKKSSNVLLAQYDQVDSNKKVKDFHSMKGHAKGAKNHLSS